MVSKTPITDFLNGCRTKGTAYSYRSGVLLFFDVLYGKQRKSDKATMAEFQEYEKLAARYLKEKRDHSADMIAFIQHMTTGKTPTKTIKIKVQGVREFFVKHRIVINETEKREIKKVMPLRARRETNFDYMTVDKIQAILPHLDIRLQSLMLCLASSGARIGELLNTNMADLDLDAKPISLFLRDTKTGEPRKVFISQEAGESIKKWYRVRDAYLETAGERSTALKLHKDVHDDKRIFPFERTAVYRAYDRALLKAGLYKKDDRTNRNTLNIHRLRAFFRETAAPIIGVDAAELLLGHVDEYDDAYRSLSPEKLAAKYLQCEEALTISNNTRIARDLKVQGDELLDLRGKVQQLAAENEMLRQAQDDATKITDPASLEALMKNAPPEFFKLIAKEVSAISKKK